MVAGAIVTEDTVTLLVPVLDTDMVMVCEVSATVANWTLVILSSSVFICPMTSAPIHAATAMLTATVTAIRMIDATTGLSALVFFFIFLIVFIFSFYPSFWD